MKKQRRIVSIILLVVLLFSLSVGVFAESDLGTTRPKSVIRVRLDK